LLSAKTTVLAALQQWITASFLQQQERPGLQQGLQQERQLRQRRELQQEQRQERERLRAQRRQEPVREQQELLLFCRKRSWRKRQPGRRSGASVSWYLRKRFQKMAIKRRRRTAVLDGGSEPLRKEAPNWGAII
jgi:hypothetical protein